MPNKGGIAVKNIMPMSYKNLVAAPHYLASQVGTQILGRGGNAMDASVAVSAALGVVYPHMTGIGGDAFFMIHHKGTISGFNGSGRSGHLATREYYLNKGCNAIPGRGVESAITVPGMADAWWEVWSRYGKLSWMELLQPAIEYAEEGFPISRDLHHWMVTDEELIRASEPMSRVFLENGKLKNPGDRLVQPALAASLKSLQLDGRDAFYKGALMKAMTEAIGRDGGLLREEDFHRHHGEWVEPLTVNYRGYDVFEMPPNSQGFSALMMLNMLENADMGKIPRHSADFYHLAVETIKQVFTERDRYLTDPLFAADIPMEKLLSKAYAKELFAKISKIDGAPMDVKPHLSPVLGQDTAYAAIVDAEGNGVSFIQSLYYDFGSCYMAGDTGIIFQNRGSYFSLDADHVNTLEPMKRSFHTLMPAMISKDGALYALLGTQGGEGQPQTQLSLITGLLDYGLTIAEAIELPRWVYGRTWGMDNDVLRMENRCPETEEAACELAFRGHQVQLFGSWDRIMGQAQGIVIDGNGLRSGAVDPRGDGMAISS
ncbi:gamma-glutamyltransferase [Paenibacillus lignilyticus]|uniref:Glutathione hydrolase proenzyme n=1 Tax=Paenibacillus lignilyticus TaxID=1172615 RepID=A0ABS5CBD2_9BACL|nr:gamma-glutamyltransferase [Paenibacillus lignilyticus]MBP3963244.1 gamma-glutamyltransferase [Paenibacillus lignilyticus]